MSERNRKVIVIGAGIGGLTAALALSNRGLDVEVYEQASRLGEVGAGIQISPNGTRVLLALGLEPELRAISAMPARKEIRHWKTGETLKWYDIGTTSAEKYGSPHVLLHRGDLHALLVSVLQRIKPN